MKALKITAGLVVGLLMVATTGFLLPARPFPALPQTDALPTRALPDGLPSPVRRYYQAVYGSEIPVITEAVITGRGRMNPNGSPGPLPFRVRFTHSPRGYHSLIELTWFGVPVVKGEEWFEDGVARARLPGATVDNLPKTNQSAELRNWLEIVGFYPAALLNDERVRWEASGEHTANLHVPVGNQMEVMKLTFDPVSGLLKELTTQRYRSEAEDRKVFIGRKADWGKVRGFLVGRRDSAQWRDQPRAWLTFQIEDLNYKNE